MAVGDVVDDLSEGPAGGAIVHVELLVDQGSDRAAYLLRQHLHLVDPAHEHVIGDGAVVLEFADGIAKICHRNYGFECARLLCRYISEKLC